MNQGVIVIIEDGTTAPVFIQIIRDGQLVQGWDCQMVIDNREGKE